ncbi:hypothetical protein ACFQ0X_17075 [Streptomyces rectiviolaceus]|uniref:hypothetical protein n=1 Tax=Streptomyces rectiviolaceus TaxID=332591 RepID=UPI00363FC2C9
MSLDTRAKDGTRRAAQLADSAATVSKGDPAPSPATSPWAYVSPSAAAVRGGPAPS